MFLKFFEGFPGVFLKWIQLILNFLYVCQSVSWLPYLRKLCQERDISSSGWYIFLKFLETFPGYFWTIFKFFLISCMSVSLSLSLLYFFQLVISGGQLLRPLVLFLVICILEIHWLCLSLKTQASNFGNVPWLNTLMSGWNMLWEMKHLFNMYCWLTVGHMYSYQTEEYGNKFILGL